MPAAFLQQFKITSHPGTGMAGDEDESLSHMI
jgi:hypothetical protein